MGRHPNMKSRLPIVTIDLGDGDYAVLIKPLLVKTQRAVQTYCLQYADAAGQVTPDMLKGHEADIMQLFIGNQCLEIRLGVVRQNKILDRVVYRKLKRYTFTEPIDYKALMQICDDIGFEKLRILEKGVNDLYAPDPLEKPASGV